MTEQIDTHFIDILTAMENRPPAAPVDPATVLADGVSVADLDDLYTAQIISRHLDLAARRLRASGQAFYTIGSSGHESNAAVAAAARLTDPALLHYRSGGFYARRAAQADGDPVRDVLLGLVAAAEEPISGGRHKVFGRKDLNVIPQTSTIASHLPRAVGVAFSVGRASGLGVPCPWPSDAIAICSIGDASANHSTTLGALNAAAHTAHQGGAMPLLIVLEDNGIGISTRTPRGWTDTGYASWAGIDVFGADGADAVDSAATAVRAVEYVRRTRRPAVLHLRTVRLMGHAGSDLETAYRSRREIEEEMGRDPVLGTARALVAAGAVSPADLLARYEAVRHRVAEVGEEVVRLPKLGTAAEVAAPITDALAEAVAATASPEPTGAGEADGTSGEGKPLSLAQSINRALEDIMESRPEAMVFGEDVGRKGGVYGVTRGLRKKFGGQRVIDTLLDEQSILGLALGAGVSDLLPIPEIQYLAYLHNAADQIRGEGATLQFFSDRRYRNPMVVRIAGYGYQKGFGGHFHNDNAVAALRDIPGLVIASPSHPADAAGMLHACVEAAATAGVVCVFLEPIALYHHRDLHEDGDGLWTAPYPGRDPVPVGRSRTHGDGGDLTIITFGNGVPMSLRVAETLRGDGVGVRVVDLRWLAPLPVDDLLREAAETGRVLVVDETRRTGGISEQIVTALVDGGFRGSVRRVTSDDSFIPLGDAALHVLLSEETVATAARVMVTSPS